MKREHVNFISTFQSLVSIVSQGQLHGHQSLDKWTTQLTDQPTPQINAYQFDFCRVKI